MPDALPQSQWFDFYSPFMSATIISGATSTGVSNRYPLWTAPVSDTVKRAAKLNQNLNHLAFLQQITVEIGLGYVPRITAVLTPTYRDGIDFLNSDLILFGSNYLEVQFGYTAGGKIAYSSPKYTGLMLPPDVQIGKDVAITLHCQGVGGFTMTRMETNDNYNNLSPKEVVKKLAQGLSAERAGITEVDDSEIYNYAITATNAALGREIRDLYETKRATNNRTGKTDWQFLDTLLNSCICTYYIAPSDGKTSTKDKLVVVPKPSMYSNKSTIVLSLYDLPGEVGPRSNVYPIIQASSPHIGVYAPGQVARQMYASGIDSKTKELHMTVFGNSDVKVDRTGPGITAPSTTPWFPGSPGSLISTIAADTGLFGVTSAAIAGVAAAAASVGKDTRYATMYQGDISRPDLLARMKSEMADQTLNMGVRLDIETIGVPNILPNNTVDVKGLSTRYDGKYTVFNVIHTLGPSGFTTKLEMYTNISKLLNSGYSTKDAGVNDQDRTVRGVAETFGLG